MTQQRPTAELAELFDAEPLVQDEGGHFNLAPTDPAAVIVQRGERRALTIYRWGLVPHWSTSASGAARMINARAETLTRSPAFREALLRRRCIVPADAFYEWRVEGGRRQPYVIRRRDRLPMAFAGLWAGWRDPSSQEVVRTFSVITTGPNDLIRPLHDRMPVILPASAFATWLDPELRGAGELAGMLVPAPPDDLELYPVAPLVNNVRNNGPELIEPIEAALSLPRLH